MPSAAVSHLRQNARRKYEAILQSAHRLFLKHGYTHTSMDEIAADAGVSKQTVYSYFTNKDLLFCRMIEADCERHDPPESVLTSLTLDPEDALYKIGHGFIDLLLSHRGLSTYRLVMSEAERHPRIARLFYESGPVKRYALLVDYLDRQTAHGTFDIDDTYKAAVLFFSIIRGPFHLQMLLKIKPSPSKKQIDDHVRETVRTFLKLYGK